MKCKMILASSLVSLIALAASVGAQTGGATQTEALTPAKQALIKEMLEVTGAAKNAEAIAASFDMQIDANIRKTLDELKSGEENASDAARLESDERIARMKARTRELYRQRLNLGRILEEVAGEVYGKRFSEEELREMVAFSKSPLGQKMNRELPQIFAETIRMVSEKIQPVMTEIAKQVVEEEVKRVESDTKRASPTRGRAANRRTRNR